MARLSGDSSTLGRIGFMLFDMLKEFITVVALVFRMFQWIGYWLWYHLQLCHL